MRLPNRLIDEKSPYLLQHAHNPVDWFPWGEAAFAAARKENKPVFLSVGYATCHWCHVMESESFEDPEAAAALNDAFVCIKVDREERPDIDTLYMTACQMVSGSGGWPLNVIMTPDKKPFFAGTYMPKRSRLGRPGLMEVCRQIQSLWQNDPKRVWDAADGITGRLDQAFAITSADGPELNMDHLDQAFGQTSRSFDSQYGGFGPAPKFPTPHRLMFLLRHHHRTGNDHALEMVTHTLTAMRHGGLWDHVGFGFHRYSTDARWLLPHFEKMLYDQALLANAYLETYRVTRNDFFSRTAEEIFAYVLRDMTHPRGGFYTAEDADSEGEEGKFYVWSCNEFDKVSGPAAERIPWQEIFNLRPEGNFADQAAHQKNGANIAHLTRSWEQWAKTLEVAPQWLADRWEEFRDRLFHHRKQRAAPLKDDKVLTDWNGLMVAALALGARALGRQSYAVAAEKAVTFIKSRLTDHNGRLLHRYRDGQAAVDGQAADYAFLIMGLIELYRTAFKTDHLAYAIALQQKMDADFWDSDRGGYYLIDAKNTELPVRPKELYDGAMPSANSVALSNLMLLARLTGNPDWEARARGLTRAFASAVARQPAAFTHFLNGLDLLKNSTTDIDILLKQLLNKKQPNHVNPFK